MRYVIHPGFVISENDGDQHWVSAGELIKLYGLPPNQLIYVLADEYSRLGYRELLGDVHLYPDATGVYEKVPWP